MAELDRNNGHRADAFQSEENTSIQNNFTVWANNQMVVDGNAVAADSKNARQGALSSRQGMPFERK